MNAESGIHIVSTLCSVIESKKTRMTKFAQPALLAIKKILGEQKLESMILHSMNKAEEEAKED